MTPPTGHSPFATLDATTHRTSPPPTLSQRDPGRKSTSMLHLYFLVAIVCISAASSQHGGGSGLGPAAHDYQDMVPLSASLQRLVYTRRSLLIFCLFFWRCALARRGRRFGCCFAGFDRPVMYTLDAFCSCAAFASALL